MNKYISQVAGFKGQSDSHLLHRLTQLEEAIRNNINKLPGRGFNLNSATKLVNSDRRHARVGNEMLNRVLANRYLTKIASMMGGICEVEPSSEFEYNNDSKKVSGNLGSFFLSKEASVDLKPHQIRALEKLDKNDGIVLDHSTGSGKSVIMLKAIEREQKKHPEGKVLFIAPASLTTNLSQQAKKHNVKINEKNLESLSYEKAVIEAPRLRKNKYILSLLDEGHKMKNSDTERVKQLGEIISNSDKRVIATATPAYNHPADIASLVNMAAGGFKVLPTTKKGFEEEYISKHKEAPPMLSRILGAESKEVSTLKNKADLKHRLNLYVDSYDAKSDPEAKKHFPTQTEKTIEVEMSPEQQQLYKYLENRLPWRLKLQVRAGLPLDKKDAAALNSFSQGIRMVSNSTNSFMPNYKETTPKINAAVNSMQKSLEADRNFKGLVYSSYLDSGVHDYSRELSKRGISHAIYTGALSKKEKDDIVADYNSGKNRVLVISSSGGEGLSLMKTRKVQVLEPAWNASKIKQVVGRAARYDSHKDLAPKDRTVEVEYYHSIFPRNFLGKRSTSIDQYLAHNSEHKDDLGQQMRKLTING